MQYETDTTTRKGKLLISKEKALNFNAKNTFCMNTFSSMKIAQGF